MATLTLSPSLATSRPATRSTGRATRPAARSAAPAMAGRSVVPVRLTRRGRLVVTMALALPTALLGAVAFLTWSTVTADPAAAGDSAGVTYVVTAGDTLWSIAAEVAGSGDVRAVLYEIKQTNGLTSGGLVPGQRLTLPAP